MKRIYTLLLAALLCAFTGCAAQAPSGAQQEGLMVCASFDTMVDFCRMIGAEHVTVTTMIPPGAEAHDWEPSPANIADLSRSDLLVINGAGFEHWVQDTIASLGDSAPMLVDTSQGIQDGGDPHIWLSPNNASMQLATICQAFSAADPDNTANYEANLAYWQTEMDKLDQQYRDAAEGFSRKDIIVTHAAYGHLCEAYGLTQHGVEGAMADSEPDPKRMAEVITLARSIGARSVFYDPSHGDQVAQAVADAIGAAAVPLHTLEEFPRRQLTSGNYILIMQENLLALQQELS